MNTNWRTINHAGLALIKSFEGLQLNAYQDQAGIWTIGYGHTGADVREGMQISEGKANALLLIDLGAAERAVSEALGDAPTTDNQFAAMVSLCFNIGPRAFRESSVLRYHCEKMYDAAASAFGWWNKITTNGQKIPSTGLTRRRAAEAKLYGVR